MKPELYNLFGNGPALPLLSTKLPPFSNPLQLILYVIPMFIVITLVNGEELAWRGFALPRLQAGEADDLASVVPMYIRASDARLPQSSR